MLPPSTTASSPRQGRPGHAARPAWEHEGTFHVEGLSCRSCARHAEDALRALPGVLAASVGFLGEIAQVVYDVRATNEHEITTSMALRGFRFAPAAGAPPSERGALDPARLGLTLALVANLLVLARLRHEHQAVPHLTWVELGITSMLLLVAAPPLVQRALSQKRRGSIGLDAKALGIVAISLALGLVATTYDASAGRAPAAALVELGFHPEIIAGVAFEAAGAVLGLSFLAAYVHATLKRRAFSDLAHAAQQRAALGHPAAELESAVDAEVHRIAEHVELEARRGGGTGFVPSASLALSVAALAFACFALVVHALVAGGPLGPSALFAALAVLVGSSSAAFVIGLPAARTIAILRARTANVVVKDPLAWGALATAHIACFEKMGVLTKGAPEVVRLAWRAPSERAILEDVAALELASTHPAGRAIAAFLGAVGIEPAALDEPARVLPNGVAGRVRGALVEVSASAEAPSTTRDGDVLPPDTSHGATVVSFRRDGVTLGHFELEDAARESAAPVMRALWRRGVGCRVLSGDTPEATLALAHALGVPARGGLTTPQKSDEVRALREQGKRVLHVGDGALLDEADVSIAVTPGASPAAQPAPVVVYADRLDAIVELVDLARALRMTERICLGIGISYNAVVIPLCAAGQIGPVFAAALAACADLCICLAAAGLLRKAKAPDVPGRTAAVQEPEAIPP